MDSIGLYRSLYNFEQSNGVKIDLVRNPCCEISKTNMDSLFFIPLAYLGPCDHFEQSHGLALAEIDLVRNTWCEIS